MLLFLLTYNEPNFLPGNGDSIVISRIASLVFMSFSSLQSPSSPPLWKKSSINVSLLLSPPCFTTLVIGNRYHLVLAIECCYWRHKRGHIIMALCLSAPPALIERQPIQRVWQTRCPTGSVAPPAVMRHYKRHFKTSDLPTTRFDGWHQRAHSYTYCTHRPTHTHLPPLSPPDRSPPPPLVCSDPSNVVLYYYGNGG